jgi:hypothetical protein
MTEAQPAPTPQQISELAQQMHREKSAAEAAHHKGHAVPWNELGESYRISLLRMAEKKLTEKAE